MGHDEYPLEHVNFVQRKYDLESRYKTLFRTIIGGASTQISP